MNLTPGNDNTNSGSDKASPATMNSSSNNTAITPPSVDRSLSNTQLPSGNNAKDMTSPDAAAASMDHDFNNMYQNTDFTKSVLFDPTTLNTDMDPTGMENPFSLNSSWSHHMPQPTGLEDASLEMTDDNMDLFSNRQFDQMLEGMGWNGWPQ
jgi:hypothetical protein